MKKRAKKIDTGMRRWHLGDLGTISCSRWPEYHDGGTRNCLKRENNEKKRHDETREENSADRRKARDVACPAVLGICNREEHVVAKETC